MKMGRRLRAPQSRIDSENALRRALPAAHCDSQRPLPQSLIGELEANSGWRGAANHTQTHRTVGKEG